MIPDHLQQVQELAARPRRKRGKERRRREGKGKLPKEKLPGKRAQSRNQRVALVKQPKPSGRRKGKLAGGRKERSARYFEYLPSF